MENTLNSSFTQERILVVDDHPTTASTLARAISQSCPGVEVISANNGRAALEQVKEEAVDLVITDMMMPDMNGLELIEKLRSHPGGRPIYTILITAYDVPGLKETARRLKVDETIIKPVRPERICQIVSRVLENMRHVTSSGIKAETPEHFKILVADDVADNVSLLTRYLQKEGYAFVTASNGLEALEKARSDMPDLILLDVNMPEKDGFEVLREIRADPALEHTPVIILTAARPDPTDIQYGLSLGADDYITKPFDRRELFARIHNKLRAKEVEEIIRRRYKELSVLPEIGREFSARFDVNNLVEVVLRRSVETLGAMTGHILVLNPNGRIYQTHSVSNSLAPKIESSILDEMIRQIRETCQGLIVVDTNADPLWHTVTDDSVRSVLITPLIGRIDLIGLLVLTHEQPEYFKSDHLLLSQAIASQAAIALETLRLQSDTAVEQQHSAAILRNTADAFLRVDAAGRLSWLNPAGEKLFTDGQARIGQPLAQEPGYETFLAMLEQAVSSGGQIATEMAWPDNRFYSAQFTPMQEGGCLVILHDMTHFRDLKKATDEFISVASHNLKHPITVIGGFTQLLPQVGPLNEKQREFIAHINTAAQNMNVLVQNMLDLLRADTETNAKMMQEKVDLDELVSNVIFEFRPQAYAKRQRLQVETAQQHPSMQADPSQLQQALHNLMDNAIKYTPIGGFVTLSLEASEGHATLRVKDSGCGIPPRDLPFVFDRFYRVRNKATKDIEGNGLGLAIVKSIVEQHHGQVSVESELGKGSCFTVTLPLLSTSNSISTENMQVQ